MVGLISRPIRPMTTTGQKMFDRMYALGISQKEFAGLAGISHSYLNSIMHGKYDLNDNVAAKINTAFELLEEEKGIKTDNEFVPPRNDWFTRKQLQEKNEEATPITPEMLVDISDVQHGKKEFIDYTKYLPKAEVSKDVGMDEKLRSLFIQIAIESENGEDIFSAYGRAVLCLIGGDA